MTSEIFQPSSICTYEKVKNYKGCFIKESLSKCCYEEVRIDKVLSIWQKEMTTFLMGS